MYDHDLFIPCRCYLGVSGLVAVGMGVIVSLSLTMLAGFPYNGIHGTVPFIALGMLQFTNYPITVGPFLGHQ